MVLVAIILARELRSYARQRRTMVVLTCLAILLANGGYTVVTVSPLVHLSFVSRRAGSVHLSGYRDLAQSALIWIGLLPVLFGAQQAAITLAGERERRSLTALLATPISSGQMLLGKLLGSLAPSLMMLSIAYTLYVGRLLAGAPGASSWIPVPVVLAALLLILGCSALMNSLALVVSALAPTVAAASITATFVLLPITLGLAVLSVNVSDVGPGVVAALGAVAVVLTALVLGSAARLLQRERLLTV